jgi:hypothetical protein
MFRQPQFGGVNSNTRPPAANPTVPFNHQQTPTQIMQLHWNQLDQQHSTWQLDRYNRLHDQRNEPIVAPLKEIDVCHLLIAAILRS